MQPNAEMSYCHVGFDLKAAREICIKLDLRYPARSLVDIDYQCALAAEMLPAALDEIERLQADNQKWREYNLQLDRKNRKQRTALKKHSQAKRERGKALVEERAYAIECNPNRTREWTHAQAIERAREQLRQEGKL